PLLPALIGGWRRASALAARTVGIPGRPAALLGGALPVGPLRILDALARGAHHLAEARDDGAPAGQPGAAGLSHGVGLAARRLLCRTRAREGEPRDRRGGEEPLPRRGHHPLRTSVTPSAMASITASTRASAATLSLNARMWLVCSSCASGSATRPIQSTLSTRISPFGRSRARISS